jgi:hypothetical protein
MTQIPIPITVEVFAAAATPEVASASLYPSLLASVDAMADPELWAIDGSGRLFPAPKGYPHPLH